MTGLKEWLCHSVWSVCLCLNWNKLLPIYPWRVTRATAVWPRSSRTWHYVNCYAHEPKTFRSNQLPPSSKRWYLFANNIHRHTPEGCNIKYSLLWEPQIFPSFQLQLYCQLNVWSFFYTSLKNRFYSPAVPSVAAVCKLVWFVSSLHFARRGSEITSLVNHTAGRLHLHKF